jgi:hypothetical protein
VCSRMMKGTGWREKGDQRVRMICMTPRHQRPR